MVPTDCNIKLLSLLAMEREREFSLGQIIKKTECGSISGATTNAFAEKFRIAKGSWDYGHIDTVPFRLRAKVGNVRIFVNAAPRKCWP